MVPRKDATPAVGRPVIPLATTAREEPNYRLKKKAKEILESIDHVPSMFHCITPTKRFPTYEVSVWSDIGSRKTQEDRCVFCPDLIKGRVDTGFFGVFDGTVGDFASDTVKALVVPHLLGSPQWPHVVQIVEQLYSRNTKLSQLSSQSDQYSEPISTPLEAHRISDQPIPAERETTVPEDDSFTIPDEFPVDQTNAMKSLPSLMCDAMDWMYLNCDLELLESCQTQNIHYSSSTSVTVLIVGGYCCVGHLGDSRVVLGFERDGLLYGEYLTADHKPNIPREHERILRKGGSVEYLHNHSNKPFIRGGDFALRKSRGDQPMQLQYSRAFGGKDLKDFGLSNEPDLRVFKIEKEHHVVILASDGVWDVQSAARAVEVVLVARERGEHPALALISTTLNEQRIRNLNADNLTAIVVFLLHDQEQACYAASRKSNSAK